MITVTLTISTSNSVDIYASELLQALTITGSPLHIMGGLGELSLPKFMSTRSSITLVAAQDLGV